jgi:hypothetical protein
MANVKYRQIDGNRWVCQVEDTYDGTKYVAYAISKRKNKAWRKAKNDLAKQVKRARKG